MRSGFRRYPRAIYQSFRGNPDDSDPIDMPETLHRLWPHELAVMWLGHGSVLAQIQDTTIAVDPVLSERIGVRIGRKTFGLTRLSPAPIAAQSLRGIDLLLITHAHFDHLDRPTLEKMADPDTRVIVPTRCRKLIPPGFGEIIELPSDETINCNGVSIKAYAPAHWGARKLFDRRRGVNAYLVESETQRVFFAGDTAHTTAFDALTKVDLAIFGIGAYDPWEHMHATPEQAWEMFHQIGARYLLPIHHSTFELSDEPINEPMLRLRDCALPEDSKRIIDPVVGEVIVIETAPDNQNTDTRI